MADPITNELRKLLAAATPTPWAVSHGDESWEVVQTKPDGTPDFRARRTAFDDGSAGGEYGPSCNVLTRDLIVAAVNALPSLLDELDALRADLREAMELLDMAEAPPDHENGGDLELWNRRRAVLRGVVEKRKETS